MNNADMPANVVPEEHWDRSLSAPATGLTKREHFAGLAMQGFIASCGNRSVRGHAPELAVEYADALLAELDKVKA
jgi:hypothetical protein